MNSEISKPGLHERKALREIVVYAEDHCWCQGDPLNLCQCCDMAKLARAGLRRPKKEEKSDETICWLLEKSPTPETSGKPPQWLRWRGLDHREWTTDANLADRFEWVIDAAHQARLLTQLGEFCFETEHVFVGPPREKLKPEVTRREEEE